MKIQGTNGIVFDVPDSVATGLIGSGVAVEILDDPILDNTGKLIEEKGKTDEPRKPRGRGSRARP